jgi:hypothetical protein
VGGQPLNIALYILIYISIFKLYLSIRNSKHAKG